MVLNEFGFERTGDDNKTKYPLLYTEIAVTNLRDIAACNDTYSLSLIIQGLIIQRLIAESLIPDQLEFNKNHEELKKGEVCLSAKFREIWDAQNTENVLRIFSSGTKLEQEKCIDQIYSKLIRVKTSN